MILFWHIRYLDRADRQFKDRALYLDTGDLDPTTRAAVELCCELSESGTSREMLRYRHVFVEKRLTVDEQVQLCGNQGFRGVHFLQDYFEDESGKEITSNEMAQILTGSPNAVALPRGADQHDVDYFLAPRAPIQIDKIAASENDLKVLGYFVRDLRELEKSAFSKDGPGRLTWSKGIEPSLQTAASDEEIRSFVTIFRRLYMSGEPANFLAVARLFAELAGDYPLVKWVAGIAFKYEEELSKKPGFAPFSDREKWTFTRKRLIDVFIYTQYAHQPSDDRIRQFNECLASVGNQRQLLTWLFLTEMWQASIHMRNAGRVIARVFDGYCNYWGVQPALLDSIRNDVPGFGQLETKENRHRRVFEAKALALAQQLWGDAGQPDGQLGAYLEQARSKLAGLLPQ